MTSPTEEQLGKIFFGYSLDKLEEIRKKGTRFVYYTTADVALNIVRTKQVWMRNASTMNDFREMEHGLDCLAHAWAGDVGTRLKQCLETISPGLADRVEQHLRGWADHLRFNTYLTCVSVHVDGEDKNGRLSMWRAYGGSNGVALVLKNTAFVAEINVLAAYTSPVLYATAEQFSEPFSQLVCSVEAAQAFLKAQGSSTVLNYLLAAMRFAVLSTKHPGFSEEQEWRIIHSPSIDPSNHLKPHLEIVNGVPQRVYKIELRDYSSEGLNGMQLSELLDRVIIGPTQYPMVMFDAFMRALDESGVQNSEHKISISGIPLRRT